MWRVVFFLFFCLYPECNQPVAAVDTGERDGANEEGLAAGGQWTVDRRVEKYWLVDSKMWSVCKTELYVWEL